MVLKRRFVVLIYGIALIGAITAFLGMEVYRQLYQPIKVAEQESVIVRIDKSTTATSLVHTLHAQGFIGSVRLWLAIIKIEGLAGKLKAGIYQLHAGESAHHFLLRIVAGDVLQERFMIRAGSTQHQLSQAFNNAPYLMYEDADWSTLTTNYPVAEGLLLADTYSYDAGSSAKELLKHAHVHLEAALSRAWEHRLAALPYRTSYDLLIVASILEKEAASLQERRLISGVIVNRLRQHMPLQMDPTVIYALGPSYTGTLSHEQLGIDSPYNTYKYRGLPPSPIAMVSLESLEAAQNPELSSYLYFVAKGDGTHEFNSTYAKHRQAIQHYMRKPS